MVVIPVVGVSQTAPKKSVVPWGCLKLLDLEWLPLLCLQTLAPRREKGTVEKEHTQAVSWNDPPTGPGIRLSKSPSGRLKESPIPVSDFDSAQKCSKS